MQQSLKILNRQKNEIEDVLILSQNIKDIKQYQQKFIEKIPKAIITPNISSDIIPDESRYSILNLMESSTKKIRKRHILININRVKESKFEFLINFLLELCYSSQELYKEDENKAIENFIECVYEYNKNFNIPFVEVDEVLIGLAMYHYNDIIKFYGEYLALKKIISEENLLDALDFIEYKLMLARVSEDDELNIFENIILNLFSYYISIKSLHAATYPFKIYSLLNNKIENFHTQTIGQIKDFPDLIFAINILFEKLSKPELFESYHKYTENVTKIIVEAVRKLEPRYIWTGELGTLRKFFRIASEEIEAGSGITINQLVDRADLNLYSKEGNGAPNNLESILSMFFKIYKSKNCHPLLPLWAGINIFQLEISMALKDMRNISLVDLYSFGLELSNKILNYVDSDVYKSKDFGLDYLDVVLVLRGLADYFDNINVYDHHKEIIERFSHLCDKHGLFSPKAEFYFYEFIRTRDIKYIKEVYRISTSIDPFKEGIPYSSPFINPMMKFIYGIFSEAETEKFEWYNRALIELQTTSYPANIPIKSLANDINESIALFYFINMYSLIEKANLEQSHYLLINDLANAYKISNFLISWENRYEPYILFCYMTNITYFIITENTEKINITLEKFKNHRNYSVPDKTFVDLVGKWFDFKNKTRIDKKIKEYFDLTLTNNHPWSKMIDRSIREQIKEDFTELIPTLDRIKSVKTYEGVISDLRGMLLEAAIALAFMNKGYKAHHRIRYKSFELVDVLCERKDNKSMEIVFIDAKNKKEPYGPSEARDLVNRFQNFTEELIFKIYPDINSMKYNISIAVFSSSKITKGAKEILKKKLQRYNLKLLDNNRLNKFLDKAGVKTYIR